MFVLTVAEIDGIYHLTRAARNGIAILKSGAYFQQIRFMVFIYEYVDINIGEKSCWSQISLRNTQLSQMGCLPFLPWIATSQGLE